MPPSNNCIPSASIKIIPPASSISRRPSPESSPISKSPTASGVQGFSGPNPFTISDLSYVWIVCDVYENDLDAVHVGESADIHLNAYPNQVFKGRIDNILPVLDPNLRTAKVRLEVKNPGHDAHRHVCHRHVLRQAAGRRTPRFRPARFCTCTTASGSTRRSATAISSAWKSSPAACCPTTSRKSFPASSRAIRSSPTLSTCRTRWSNR